MALTYHPMTGDGDDFDNVIPYDASSPVGHQDFEWARQGLAMALYLAGDGMFLGGSEIAGLVTGAATWVPVAGAQPFTLTGASLGGLTLEAVIFYYTTNASTAVQVRLRNTTDSSNAGIGTSSVSTTVVTETITLTLAAGAKSYRLEALGDATNAVVAWGYLRLKANP